jgi:hypothetical protein
MTRLLSLRVDAFLLRCWLGDSDGEREGARSNEGATDGPAWSRLASPGSASEGYLP